MNNLIYVESDHEIFTQPGGYTQTLGGYLLDTKVADRMVASAEAVTITKVWARSKKPYIPTKTDLNMYEQRLVNLAHKIKSVKGVWPARISTFQVKATVDVPVITIRDAKNESWKFSRLVWDLSCELSEQMVKRSKVMISTEATGGNTETGEMNIMICVYGSNSPELWITRFEQEVLPKLKEAVKHLA